MKRIIGILFLSLTLSAVVSCSKEAAGNHQSDGHYVELKAVMPDCKATVTAAGAVSWAEGDKIDVYTTSGAVRVFDLVKIEAGVATFSANLPAGEAPSTVAIFPSGCLKGVSGSTATINYPASYSYASGSMKAPMYAIVGGGTLSFKHLGGMMRITCNPVPSAATAFHLVCNGMQNVGNFNATVGESMEVASSSASTNTKCKVNFDAAVGDSKTFLVPVPTGEYSSVYAYFTDASGNKIREWQVLEDKTVEKADMYVRSMPALMRVLDFNWLLDSGSTDKKQPWTTVRKANMIAALPGKYYDVMASQESTTQQISDIQASVPGYSVTGVSHRGYSLSSIGSSSDYSVTAIWRGSNVTLLDNGTFWYSSTPNSASRRTSEYHYSACNWAKLSFGGKTFYYFNVHLAVNGDGKTTGYDPKYTEQRLYQWSILKPRIAAVAGDYPVILSGDFNNTVNDDGDVIQTILADTDLNLIDAYAATDQPHGALGTLNYFITTDSGRRIDFVFVNDKFKVESYRVDHSQQTASLWESDHNPVIVDLSFVE